MSKRKRERMKAKAQRHGKSSQPQANGAKAEEGEAAGELKALKDGRSAREAASPASSSASHLNQASAVWKQFYDAVSMAAR